MSYTADDLVQAEQHVAHGERFVRFQEAIVFLKKGRGSAGDQAEIWLSIFEAGLEKHVAERDRIAAELASRFPD